MALAPAADGLINRRPRENSKSGGGSWKPKKISARAFFRSKRFAVTRPLRGKGGELERNASSSHPRLENCGGSTGSLTESGASFGNGNSDTMGQCASTAAGLPAAAVASVDVAANDDMDKSGPGFAPPSEAPTEATSVTAHSRSAAPPSPRPCSLAEAAEYCRGGTVVLSGCGGGYDVVGSAPLLHHLRGFESDGAKNGNGGDDVSNNTRILLVNLSFTHPQLLMDYGVEIFNGVCYRIDPGSFYQSRQFSPYFPEALYANAVKLPVFTIVRGATVEQIQRAYRAILKEGSEDFGAKSKNKVKSKANTKLGKGKIGKAKAKTSKNKSKAEPPSLGCSSSHSYDVTPPSARALFLIDGGSDVLLTGDETGLATPAEDMLHLRSVLDGVDAPLKTVLCKGVNVDCGHGILQAELDERLEQLEREGAMLFRERLDEKDANTQEARPDAAFYSKVVGRCDPSQSIVQSLVVASIEGKRGYDVVPPHLHARIGKRSRVPLTDQTATVYAFDLNHVADSVKYLDRLTGDCDVDGVTDAIKTYRNLRVLRKTSIALGLVDEDDSNDQAESDFKIQNSGASQSEEAATSTSPSAPITAEEAEPVSCAPCTDAVRRRSSEESIPTSSSTPNLLDLPDQDIRYSFNNSTSFASSTISKTTRRYSEPVLRNAKDEAAKLGFVKCYNCGDRVELIRRNSLQFMSSATAMEA